MTLPRRFINGSTYFITRRITQRQFWLKPTKDTNQIFAYCLAYAAMRTGVQVHAVCVMSNHWHAIVSDPGTEIARFYHHVHRLVATAVNASYGRWENLWSSEKTSVIPLESAEDVFDKMRYIACNPVEAGLVNEPKRWPGLLMYKTGQSKAVKRPDIFFNKYGVMPEKVTLYIDTPPILENMKRVTLLGHLAELVNHSVSRIKTKMRDNGRTFMGASNVLKQRAHHHPFTREPRRKMNPRVACKSKWYRIERLKLNKGFLNQYAEAWEAWTQTQSKSIVFPAGTYMMRIFNGVKCAPG